jgi:hypothetical protein
MKLTDINMNSWATSIKNIPTFYLVCVWDMWDVEDKIRNELSNTISLLNSEVGTI